MPLKIMPLYKNRKTGCQQNCIEMCTSLLEDTWTQYNSVEYCIRHSQTGFKHGRLKSEVWFEGEKI